MQGQPRYQNQSAASQQVVNETQSEDYKNVHQIDTSNSRSDDIPGIEIVQWNKTKGDQNPPKP